MKLYPVTAAAALLLAACQPETDAPERNGVAPRAADGTDQNLPAPVTDQRNTQESPSAPADEGDSASNPPPTGQLPPSGSGPRFVGLWASDAQSCASRAWRFTANSLRTPAGSVCRFSSITPVPGGYDIAARCTAEGPETADAIEIRFAESAQAMLFESAAIADAGLVYCGEGG